MKATELRIGNYIKDSFSVHRVRILEEFIGDGRINDNLGVRDFEPIPLTEDWLLKFGFTIYEDEYVYEPTNFELSRVDGEFYFNVEGNVTGKPIKFVHELQNLYFAINREELMIKS